MTGTGNRIVLKFFLSFSIALSSLAWSLAASSASSTSVSVPEPPQNVQADVIGNMINVYWQAPANDGGSSVSSYSVALNASNPGISSPSVVILCSTVATSLNCSFTPITAPTSLYVFAVNSIGYSTGTGVSIPSYPLGESGYDIAIPGRGQITVKWDAYYASEGTTVSYQVVMRSHDIAYNGRTCATTALTCVFTGLPSNQTFAFIILGTDGHGAFTSPVTTALVSPLTSATTTKHSEPRRGETCSKAMLGRRYSNLVCKRVGKLIRWE